jgi:hypothetical protein
VPVEGDLPCPIIVKFSFSNDYNTVVTNVDLFSSNLRSAMASKYGISSSRISNIKVSSGSIVVSMDIASSSDPSEPSATTVVDSIREDVTSNTFPSVGGQSLATVTVCHIHHFLVLVD